MKIIKYWRPLFIAGIIFYGSLTSSNTLNKVTIFHIHNMDKIIHFLLYFTLSISLQSSLVRNSLLSNKYTVLITIIFVISYGLLMEVFQYYFTSDRSAELLDAVANFFGCIVGIFIFPLLQKMHLTKYL